MKTQRVTVLECYSFSDGVRLAHVTYEIGNGERRCVAAHELAALGSPFDDEPQYDDDGQLVTDPSYRSGF